MKSIPPLSQELQGVPFIQPGLRLSLIVEFHVPGLRGSDEVNDSDVMAITVDEAKKKVRTTEQLGTYLYNLEINYCLKAG